MKKLLLLFGLALTFALVGCGQIETGNVGVRTQFGKIQPTVESEGVYLAVLSHVDEYTAKETFVTLKNLTPKAKDKLLLKELDVTVYYRTRPEKIVQFASTHAGMSARFQDEKFWRPGYYLIENVAKGVISDETSKFDSLTLHQNRQALESAIGQSLSAQLEKSNPGNFEITRVVISSLLTDPSVEESIRKNIAMSNEIDTARKDVDKKLQEAAAMKETANALTPMLIQHEYVKAIARCADNPKCTLIVGSGGPSTMLNLPK